MRKIEGGKGKTRNEGNKWQRERGVNSVDYKPSTTVCCKCLKIRGSKMTL